MAVALIHESYRWPDVIIYNGWSLGLEMNIQVIELQHTDTNLSSKCEKHRGYIK